MNPRILASLTAQMQFDLDSIISDTHWTVVVTRNHPSGGTPGQHIRSYGLLLRWQVGEIRVKRKDGHWVVVQGDETEVPSAEGETENLYVAQRIWD